MESWEHELSVLRIMLDDRKYTNIKRVDLGEEPVILYTCKDTSQELTHVYFSREIKVGVKVFRKIKHDCISVGGSHIILICKEGLTPFAQKELADLDTSIAVEIIKKKELCTPVIHHKLVPLHIPLTAQEKKQLMIELACNSSSLSKIKETDAVVKYMNFQRGTVLKIVQQLGTLESGTKYRIVV